MPVRFTHSVDRRAHPPQMRRDKGVAGCDRYPGFELLVHCDQISLTAVLDTSCTWLRMVLTCS